MGKVYGGEPEKKSGYESGISEEDTYVCVIAEYVDLGDGLYGPQGLFLCQVEEAHPNGKPKETWVYFDNTTLGNSENPSKLRSIAEKCWGKKMPQDVAEEKGIDPDDLIGLCFRASLVNKIAKKSGNTYIEAKNFLELKGANKITIRDYEKWCDRPFNKDGGNAPAKARPANDDGGFDDNADEDAPW